MQRIPVSAAGWQGQRPARRHAEQAAVRIEEVQERMEVVFVRPAPVEEDERAGRLARRFSYFVVHAARGSGSGVRTSSSRSRSGS
jgi:hypothetical protein